MDKKFGTEDVVKGLDESAQKVDVIAAAIFKLIDVNDQSG